MSMKKIAEKAGVSISTVSLALSGKGRVSQQVRERVLAAARELNYKSPLYAESRQNIALLYAIDTEWRHALEFINPIIQQLESDILAAGFVPVIIPIKFSEDTGSISKKIQAVRACGVCSIHYTDRVLFTELEGMKIPVVIINNSNLQGEFSTVCVDDFQGAYEGGKHLLAKTGGGQILYAGYDRENIAGRIDDRLYGLQKALLESGEESCSEFYAGDNIAADAAAYFGELTKNAALPDAIFAYDDFLAGFIYSQLKELSLSLPEDILLLAPGDTLNYTLSFIPQISTMQIDTAMLGQYGVNLILQRVNNKSVERNQVFKVRQNLMERTTT